MQNVEFKSELRDRTLVETQCRALGARMDSTFDQVDSYFKMPDGRLKKRESSNNPTEWIYYHRANTLRPKVSRYAILNDEQARHRWGTLSLRPWLVVKKRRALWMMDENTRIHLDEVESLGRFLEVEAMVCEKYSECECEQICEFLREHFQYAIGEMIGESYSDMLARVSGWD